MKALLALLNPTLSGKHLKMARTKEDISANLTPRNREDAHSAPGADAPDRFVESDPEDIVHGTMNPSKNNSMISSCSSPPSAPPRCPSLGIVSGEGSSSAASANGQARSRDVNGHAPTLEGNGRLAAAKSEQAPISSSTRRGHSAHSSKKVLIVTTIVPFTRGGDRHMADSLELKLREYGHEVELLLLPFSNHYAQIPQQLVALKLLHMENYADRLITIRTPSYIVNHPNKACWFIHHHRGAFDLWNTDMQSMPATPEGLAVRRLLIRSDNDGLASAKQIYANSRVVADRLEKFNQIKAGILYPPLKSVQGFRCDRYGDYLLYVSRIAAIKRQHLAVEAMRYVKSGVKLVVAGNPDSPADREQIKRALASSGAENRITILDRFISEQEKQELMANALGCLYFPLGEDSYGYVGLEASYSEKAIITTTDSGGVLELVAHGSNGLVVTPNAVSLARAMDQLYDDQAAAERMGHAARRRVDELGISWDHVIEALLK